MAIYGSVAWAAIALLLIQRGLFAVGDRRTPLRTGLAAVAFNLIVTPLGAWLAGGIGLAAATAVTVLFHLGMSFVLLQRHVVAVDWPLLRARAGRSLAATIAMMVSCAGIPLIPSVAESRFLQLATALPIGIA